MRPIAHVGHEVLLSDGPFRVTTGGDGDEMEVAIGDLFVQARVIRTRKSAVFVVAILQEERATCVPPASRGFSTPGSRLAYRFNRIRRENDRQNPGRG